MSDKPEHDKSRKHIRVLMAMVNEQFPMMVQDLNQQAIIGAKASGLPDDAKLDSVLGPVLEMISDGRLAEAIDRYGMEFVSRHVGAAICSLQLVAGLYQCREVYDSMDDSGGED